MAAKQKKPKFSGELAHPIELPPHPQENRLAFLNEESRGADMERRGQQWMIDAAEYFAAARNVKLPLVFEHYGVPMKDPDALPKLAMLLIFDLVPGFQMTMKTPAKKRGRKNTWDWIACGRLYRDMRDEIVSRQQRKSADCSELAACKALLKREPWRSMPSVKKVKTLYNRFLETKNSEWAKIFGLDENLRDTSLASLAFASLVDDWKPPENARSES